MHRGKCYFPMLLGNYIYFIYLKRIYISQNIKQNQKLQLKLIKKKPKNNFYSIFKIYFKLI